MFENVKFDVADLYQYIIISAIIILLIIGYARTGELNQFLIGTLTGSCMPLVSSKSKTATNTTKEDEQEEEQE